MNTEALILMLTVQLTVIIITGYFFIKVLRTPPKQEPDSFSGNDPDPAKDDNILDQ